MMARSSALLVSSLAALTFGASGAFAGGLVLPGNGAVSSSRAGAWIVGVDGADAVAINPAGLTRRAGTHLSVSAVFADYSLTFARRGSYDQTADATLPWEGEPFAPVSDDSSPPAGIAGFQAVPTIVVATDLGNRIKGLHLGFGFYAPNAYPTRALGADYTLDDPNVAPPPSRYDVVSQEALLVQTNFAVGYQVTDKLSVGGSFTWGATELSATTYLWGQRNFEEWTGSDTVFEIDAADWFVPAFGLGAVLQATSSLEFGARWTSQLDVHAKGTARSTPSASLNIGGLPVEVLPVDDAMARCATGGTADALKGCIDFALPMAAYAGARYVFRDRHGRERGDLEFDVGWENWSAERASDYKVVVDGQVNNAIVIKDAFIRHGLQDVINTRLGGSYHFPVGAGEASARAGVSYDTAAARPGWERVDFDGAARTTMTAGASYRSGRYQFDLGFGAVLEGTRDMPGNCNPTVTDLGCTGDGTQRPIGERIGPDPTNPAVETANQDESPVNQGTFESGYTLFMLGMSTWF